MDIPIYLYILCVAILFGAIRKLNRIGRRPADFPPGPPTLPILGNIHQLPKSQGHLQFQKWAQEYGPVYSLILGTQVLIVLSNDVAIKELLDKRGGIHSDRLEMYIGQTLCSGGYRFLMLFRRLGHQLLNVQSSKAYVPYQILESKQLLREILDRPDLILESLRRYSNSLSTHMIYGWRTVRHDDPRLLQVFKGFNDVGKITQTGTSAFLDFFPILRWLPEFLTPMKRQAKELHKKEMDMYLNLWLEAKQSYKSGTYKDCICVSLAQQQDKNGFTDEQAAYVAGSFLEAGSDTTSSTLYGFIQAMILFPEVQRKAQAEIDRVIGPDRLPTLDDEDNLPYIRGCVKESLRWMPTALLAGVPHASNREDQYMGYRIPAGAGLVNNVYTIHMDPQRYPDPRAFKPERFEGDMASAADSALNPDPSKRDHYVFGSGRRICLGIHVAERSLFIAISRMLWAFDFLPELDPSGNPILPDPNKLTEGLSVLPEKFGVQIIPRDEARARKIMDESMEIMMQ
ncbi:hypothetical protein FP744_10003416 [Trichoderma asperellum]